MPRRSMYFSVAGDPYPWPHQAKVSSGACAVIVVDMQDDYCSQGHYIDRAGYDLKGLQAPIEPIKRVLAAARRAGMPVIYTRHAGTPNADRSARSGARDRRQGVSADAKTAARGEPGWHIVKELSPQADEVVVDKSTISAFASSDLDGILRSKSIGHLAFCGNTIDVCVHSTLRSAVDLGYECLLLEDCCGAVNEGLHTWAIESVKIEDGIFGTVASSAEFVDALSI